MNIAQLKKFCLAQTGAREKLWPEPYNILVYALDTKVDVTASADTQPIPAALETRANVMKAMQRHVLGKAVLVARFHR